MSDRDSAIRRQIAQDLGTIVCRVQAEEREDLSVPVARILGMLSVLAGTILQGGATIHEAEEALHAIAMRGLARYESEQP